MDYDVLRNAKQFAQLLLPNSNVCVLFSKSASRKITLTNIQVVNTTSSSATYSLFLDVNGTVANATTALAYSVALAANTVALYEWQGGLPLNLQSAGQFAAQSNTANAICITVNGIEF